MKAILAIKNEMQTFFDKEGRAEAVTTVTAGPCVVMAVKESKKDNFRTVQLGFGEKRKKIGKPLAGLVKKLGLKNCPNFLREIKTDDGVVLMIGQEIRAADVFKEGEIVSVSGVSKGKGFAGVVKRWGFKGGPRTHGQSDRERAPGSIGSTTTPGRVYKGKKMAGKMGGRKITVKNLEIFKIDPEKNSIMIKGALPGIPGGLLLIAEAK